MEDVQTTDATAVKLLHLNISGNSCRCSSLRSVDKRRMKLSAAPLPAGAQCHLSYTFFYRLQIQFQKSHGGSNKK